MVIPVFDRPRNCRFAAIDVCLPDDIRHIAERHGLLGLQMDREFDLMIATEADVIDIRGEEFLQHLVFYQEANLLADLRMPNRPPVLNAFGGRVLN